VPPGTLNLQRLQVVDPIERSCIIQVRSNG